MEVGFRESCGLDNPNRFDFVTRIYHMTHSFCVYKSPGINRIRS
jgi:hypothetical protein